MHPPEKSFDNLAMKQVKRQTRFSDKDDMKRAGLFSTYTCNFLLAFCFDGNNTKYEKYACNWS